MRNEKLSDMLAAVAILPVVFGVIAVPVIGVGIALGYGLRALIPGLDPGWAIVAGAVFAAGIADMTVRSLLAIQAEIRSEEEEDEEEKTDET